MTIDKLREQIETWERAARDEELSFADLGLYDAYWQGASDAYCNVLALLEEKAA